ncbi:MAG: ABC transporter ATP-binding protein [Candidatus Omnitrophota bacterium]|nr:ABC transporter ATP-binding protein [Candidatus Omnitrophota bacterium]
MLVTKSLRVDYEDVTAVQDLSFEIKAGQIYGLVGPNGAGKTSTIKALAGIIEPTYGEISIAGHDLEFDHEQALQGIGFMPDFPPVYENLKVWEYLDVFAAAYLLPRSERITRCRYWIEQVNLSSKWDAFVRDLSRGMRQRLVLAKTLLHNPKVLLLDEPASGLDPIARMEFRKLLKNISSTGMTILISSHILTELSDFCNAVGIMEKGRMVVSGSIDEIRRHIGSKGQMFIRLANAEAGAQQRVFDTLKGYAVVTEPQSGPSGEIRALFSGERKDSAHILAALVSQGVPVSDFYVKEADVEDIFFKIGAKEVS